jgi:large subunit ribosomal protein L6e|tara:strand:- start:30389 stop:30523 length:135 start_codon:yes stop_codon:yes gene_type:complete
LDKVSEDGYFTKDKAAHKPGEDSFFKQGEKPEVCSKEDGTQIWY